MCACVVRARVCVCDLLQCLCVYLCVQVDPPKDLPSALARISELEDVEFRLRGSLLEAVAACDAKNKLLEETAAYIESLEAELQ